MERLNDDILCLLDANEECLELFINKPIRITRYVLTCPLNAHSDPISQICAGRPRCSGHVVAYKSDIWVAHTVI